MVHSFFGPATIKASSHRSRVGPSRGWSRTALSYNEDYGFRLVRSCLCIRDDRATENSAVFQIINRFIDLLERVSPGHQLI
jgi:hypothetical protein